MTSVSSTRVSGRIALALAAALLLPAAVLPGPAAQAEVCNIRVVTDANPDYTDIGSMLHSITSNWQETKDKCWAIFYWNHIARRQTAPMQVHGMELTDPIRQFNDYGYTMCSTIAGNNCAIFGALGLNVRFWDISMHTVMDVEYDGAYHMYDSSLTALYTLCDGKTLAPVDEIGQEGACEASGGKVEPGHIAKYHCLYASSKNGFLTGADTPRSVAEEYRCFNPGGLKFRYYTNNWDLGHRYILNLRDNEVYTRTYHRTDIGSPNAVVQNDKNPKYLADPAYFVPNGKKDPESVNERYHIRGNGLRTWAPPLTADGLAKNADTVTGLKGGAAGVEPAVAGSAGEVVFKVEGANVITSMVIKAALARKGADDVAAISVSDNNGLTWKEVFKADKTGEVPAEIKLIDEVNGAYEVLVMVSLMGKAAPGDARLTSISFDTITMVNSKTQPTLKLGKNTVYVGAGEQTESVVIWPELQGETYKSTIVEEKNIATEPKHKGWYGVMFPTDANEDAYIVYRIDTPADMTRLVAGGRYYNRAAKSRTQVLYSLDKGETWTKMYELTDTTPPWDTIHYDKADIPAGHKSVLVKYLINTAYPQDTGHGCSIYAVRMEANYKPADTTFKPMEVTFAWKERQEDYGKFVERSHTQLVEKVPFTYTINVAGADHPIVDSLTVNLKGARQATASPPAEVKYGYSDGKDVGGEKFQGRWVTFGKNLAEGKPYTCSAASLTQWGSGDPDGKKLTDGVVGSSYTGGVCMGYGPMWDKGPVDITVDLGQDQKMGAFRIHTLGYPWWDAGKGQVKDKVEVLTSADDKEYASQGFFNFDLRWKDLPANYMWTDEETFCGHNFELILPKPVEARYVRYRLSPARNCEVTEVQVLDFIKYEPFDLKIALPDGKDRSDITLYPLKHTPSKEIKVPARKFAGSAPAPAPAE